MTIRTPWEAVPPRRPPPATPQPQPARRRGRRRSGDQPAAGAPNWLYHHLDVSGPADAVDDFAAAARGPGLIPWPLDGAGLEEDVFNLAACQPTLQPTLQRSLTVEGCRRLARQFRTRVEARHARATGMAGQCRACPLDLHALLPVPPAILRLGATDPATLAWLAAHWGTRDPPRQVVERPATADTPNAGPRLPAGHGARGYGFFTDGDTPHVAVARLAGRWTALRWNLRARPG